MSNFYWFAYSLRVYQFFNGKKAGIFRGAGATAAVGSVEVEEGDEGSGGEGGSSKRDETTVEISSENSGLARSRSEDDLLEHEDDDVGDKSKKKKRKKYHRHTAEQIREMEA